VISADAASQSPEPMNVFLYVGSEKVSLYRAIMRVFVESRERFSYHLRAEEVADALRTSDSQPPDQREIESALAQLCQWGNLEADAETSEASIVEEFYAPRPTFRMTSRGEAAEQALTLFDENSHPQGSLHESGVADIRLVFQELRRLAEQEQPDAGKINRELLLLRVLFDDLSATAQNFIGRLERKMDLQPLEARRLVDYGQGLIDELVLEADAIAQIIRDIEARGLERLLQPTAEQANQWLSHWQRFRIWFIAEQGSVSHSERLRERARKSIPALLSMIANQQQHRIDRSSDFRVLARWFAQAPSDAEAHRLWRAAFGLCSARHLAIDDATLDDRAARHVPANISWLEAPPLRVPARLQNSRVNSRTGGLSRMIDRSAEKQKLAAASQREAERLLNAHRRFGNGNRIRLSELEHLQAGEFELFLDLLGETVSNRVFESETREILSGDGCFRIKLEPTEDERDASILTTDGMFSGPDHWISIEQISTEFVK
jgi:uncharacterized protein (TIGR02677 family)